MASFARFVGPSGIDPSTHIINIASAFSPTIGDALYGGQIVRSRILQRTASGIDSDGAPFAPYSDAYRRRKGAVLGHTNNVDLFGPTRGTHMLNALLVKANGRQLSVNETAGDEKGSGDLFEVGFYGQESVRAKVHNEGATIRTRLGRGKGKLKKDGKASFEMPRRHFLDVSKQDIELIERGIGERMLQRATAIS